MALKCFKLDIVPLPWSVSAANAPASPDMSELTLTVSEVQSVLEALDVTKAIASDKIPANFLRKQWGREKSAPGPYETDPFLWHLSSTLPT